MGTEEIQSCWRVEHDGEVVKGNEARKLSRIQIMKSLLNLIKEIGKKDSKKWNII